MKVCIAEKPSVAREIAMILGAKSQKMDTMKEMVIRFLGHLGTCVHLKNLVNTILIGNIGI